MTSSVCDICQGLFDMKSSRGFVKDRNEYRYWISHHSDDPYVYSYIHRRTRLDIVESGRAGCDVCTLIGGSREGDGPFGRRTPLSLPSPGENTIQPISGAQAAQSEGFDLEKLPDTSGPDEDKWEPSKLARFMEEHPSLSFKDFLNRCDERVVIQHHLREQGSLPSDTSITMSIVCWVVPNPLYNISWRPFYHFNTPFDPIDPDWERRPSNDPLSESHIRLINRWRHVCEEKHESCRKIAYHQTLPTRILELAGHIDEVESVRLVETHGKAQGTYACLSYCWGDSKAQVGKTCRDNLFKQLQLIRFKDLPSTVVDAIRLCYRLGFQYLWVDRLCIIQDDVEDWLMEASKMCDIYSRSALTLSAPICTDSSQSFLAKREKGFQKKRQFAIITYDEHASEGYQRWFTNDRPSWDNGPWFLEDGWSSRNNIWAINGRKGWLGRCWTFQEWMLSPRVLHIDSMTLWDCFDGYANELNCRYMADPKIIRNPSRFGKDLSWDFIVREFSGRKITLEEDRLPALAGLATRYAQMTGHSYLAGLWVEDLPWSLLWEKDDRRNREHPQPWSGNRHTPSWTWCSLNGAVWYDYFDRNSILRGPFIPSASIKSTFCQYQPPGSFSKVEKAWICMECRVCAVTTQHDRKVYAGGTTEPWDTAPDYDYDYGEDVRNGVEDTYLLLLGGNELYSGALIAKMFKGDDRRSCFRRLGVARRLDRRGGQVPEKEPQWETRLVLLV